MFKKYHVLLMSIFFALDIIIVIFALYLADQIYPMLQGIDMTGENIYVKGYIYLGAVLIWAIVFRIFPTYGSKRAKPVTNDLIGVGFAVLTSWIIFTGGLFVSGVLNISRSFLLIFGLLNLCLLLVFHLMLRITFRIFRLKGYNLKKVLIIGAGSVGQMIAKELLDHPWTGFSIVGFLDDNPNLHNQTILSIPVLGNLDDVYANVEKMDVDDEVIIALPHTNHPRLVEVIRKIEDIPVNIRIIPDFFSVAYIRPNIEELWGIPLIGIRNSSIHPLAFAVKRVIDFVGALIGLIVFFPVMLIVPLLIKVDDPDGPVLFFQKRIGENGKPFDIIKFRTMANDAEEKLSQIINLDELEEPVFKNKNDPRVTRMGQILRRTSVDEFPQLINVLRGEMSLVGPRPEEAQLVQRYNSWERKRLMMKPGITGPSQVQGRSDLTFKKKVEFELEYIENYTLTKDIEILLKTIPAVIRGKGCY